MTIPFISTHDSTILLENTDDEEIDESETHKNSSIKAELTDKEPHESAFSVAGIPVKERKQEVKASSLDLSSQMPLHWK